MRSLFRFGSAEAGNSSSCSHYSSSVAVFSVDGCGVIAIPSAALGSNKSMQPTVRRRTRLKRSVSPVVKREKIQYPFVPKSTSSLIPGHYWALPLSDGSYGCGRVIQLKAPAMTGARVSFLAAVLDWHSRGAPSSESIAGATCLAQGHVHIKAITEIGGLVLGHRGLELDGIEPWLFRGAHGWQNSQVQLGFISVRPQTPEDSELPVFSTWGFDFAANIADARFVKRSGPWANKLVQATRSKQRAPGA